ncbi:MAG: hypothetical protein JSS49_01430 [Planctomycetes bacterium]|nr:hypothetical protein [Planctomycetota bacterium]
MADPTGSVKPKAVAPVPSQSNMQGVWGKGESGLAPTEELRLVAQSLGWLDGQRFPTRLPIDQVTALAEAENRKLTGPEVVVVTAGKFLNYCNEKPASFREVLRKQRLILKACKIIIQAEMMNQAEDHRNADLPE